jgi:hypothetical protein
MAQLPWKTTATEKQVETAYTGWVLKNKYPAVNWVICGNGVMEVLEILETAKVATAKVIITNGVPVTHVLLKHGSSSLTINGDVDPVVQIFLMHCAGFQTPSWRDFLVILQGLVPAKRLKSFLGDIKRTVSQARTQSRTRTRELIQEYNQRSVKRAMVKAAGILRPLVRAKQLKRSDMKEIWDMLVVEEIHES